MYAYELLYIPGRCRHSIRKGCGGFLRERLVSLICIYVYCNEWRSNRVHMYVCTILLHTPFSWLCNSLARSESLRIRPLYIYRSVFSYLVCMYYIYVCIYTVYIYINDRTIFKFYISKYKPICSMYRKCIRMYVCMYVCMC